MIFCDLHVKQIKLNSFLRRCKNTHKIMENHDKTLIVDNFKKCVEGFHLINSCCINETIWEDINALIFSSSGINIHSKSNGCHLSGMDIECSFGKISNKSAKYSNNKKNIDISSYRLTTVCSEKNHGTIETIIDEINKRKNFDYYSIIIRDEHKDFINYDWLLITSDYFTLNPSSYIWRHKLGKNGKNKNNVVGWNTNDIDGSKMSISFSMSSQLWLHIQMTDQIKKFIIASVTVRNKPKFNYIDLFMFNNELQNKNSHNQTEHHDETPCSINLQTSSSSVTHGDENKN